MTGHRGARRGAAPVPGRQAAAAHGVRRHRRRDHGDQRHRARLLPAQAVGPARGAALPGRRRPARRLAATRTPTGLGDVRVVGHRWSERSHEVKTFLARNHVPYRWLDVERDDEARRLRRARRSAGTDDLPLVLVPDGETLRGPVDARAGRGARAAHPGRAAALRPVHRRRRPGRAGGRGVRRVRGAADRGRRARRARRPGRAERVDRELPRLPQGAVRRRPHPPRGRPGVAVRRRDGAGPRRGRLRAARARCARCCSTAAATIEARAVLVATGVSYRRLEAPGLRRRSPARGVYYGATASEAQPVRRATRSTSSAPRTRPGRRRSTSPATPSRWCWWSAAPSLEDVDVAVPRRPDPGGRQHRGPAAAPRSSARSGDGHLEALTLCDDGDRRDRGGRRPAGCSSSSAPSPRTDWLGDDVARDDKGFVVTGHGPARPPDARLAAGPAAVRARDQRARGVRRRRRAAGLDEAGRLGRRRGCDVGLPRPPLPGDDADAT